MKSVDIDNLSEEEAKELLKEFYNSPYIGIYFSMKTQIDRLSKDIEKTKIDFKEDSAPFKNFITWGKESLTMINNLDEVLSKIDKTILKEQQERRTKAEDGSLESYIRK